MTSAPSLPAILLGGSPLNEDSLTFLDDWYAAGGRAIDTARVYGAGCSERAIGSWLTSRGHRDVQIVSKGCHCDAAGPRISEQALRDDLAQSHEALQGAPIAVYLLHRDNPAIPAAEIIDMMQCVLDEGHAAAIGVSNWHHERIAAANAWARTNDKTPFSWNSPQWSAVSPTHMPWAGCLSIGGDDAAIAYHQQEDAPSLLVWQPLAVGFLAGRPKSSLSSRQEAYASFDTPANRERLEELRQTARSTGRTLAQESLHWLLSKPRCHVVLGTSSAERWLEAQGAIPQ